MEKVWRVGKERMERNLLGTWVEEKFRWRRTGEGSPFASRTCGEAESQIQDIFQRRQKPKAPN